MQMQLWQQRMVGGFLVGSLVMVIGMVLYVELLILKLFGLMITNLGETMGLFLAAPNTITQALLLITFNFIGCRFLVKALVQLWHRYYGE